MAPGPQVVAVGEAARAGRRRRRRRAVRVAVPDQLGRRRRGARRPATTSCSQLVPGKTTTPIRGATQIGLAARARLCSSMTGLASSRSASSVAWASAVGLVGRVDLEAEGPCPPARAATPSKPRAGSARSIVAPCGSAIPGRSRTSTCTENSREPHASAPYQSANERPRDPLVGGDVARRGGRHDLGGQRRRGRLLVPGLASSQSRSGCLSKAGGLVPGTQSSAGQNREESGCSTSSQRRQRAVDEAELELGVGQMTMPCASAPGRGPRGRRPGRARAAASAASWPDQVDGLGQPDVQVVALGRPWSTG